MSLEFSTHPLLATPPTPQDKPKMASLTVQGWEKVNLNEQGLLAYFNSGGAIAPVFMGGVKKNENWYHSQFVALDFDNGTDKPAIAAHNWLNQWLYFVGYTPSHTPENPRTRVILPLRRPIYNLDQHRQIAKTVLQLVKDLDPDPSSTTPARFYFGYLPNSCEWHTGQTLSEDVLGELALFEPAPLPNPPEPITTDPSNDFSRYCERVLEGVLGELRGARVGTRNNTLFNAACQLGERLHLDGFSRLEAENWLMSEALALGLSDNEAQKTIRSGLEKGQANPKDPLPKQETYRPPQPRLDAPQNPYFPRVTITLKLDFVGFDDLKRYYHQGEFGDARLFYRLFKDLVVWDEADKAWYVWQGHYWKRDDYIVRILVANQLAWQYAHASAELYRAKPADFQQEDEDKPPIGREELIALYQRHAKSLRSKGRRENILNHAQALMRTDGEAWDSNPYLLATTNGVIDLCTGELNTGNPRDFLRTYTETKWQDLNTPAPRFERFMSEIFDENTDLVHFIHRLLGYAISGLSTEHILPIFFGAEGRNGKDTLLETLGTVLGSISGSVSRDVIMDNKMSANGAASPHLVSLQGKRLVWTSETKEGATLDTNQVKYITGGGRIRCRPLYGAEREFTPTHTILLITNHKPRIPNGGDRALWTRLALIPFTVRFVDNPTLPHERKKDPHLRVTLQDEASGILAWLVRGFLAYQQAGLNPPETVQSATDEYRGGEDDLQQFLETACLTGANFFVRSSELYEAYKDFGGSMSTTLFGRKMGKMFTKDRVPSGSVYRGIALRGAND